MLYGNMREGSSQRVVLNDITSAVFNIILGFIHTETIDHTVNISIAVGIYRAASFLLLPKLMKMVLERAHDLADFGVASSLLNEAVAIVPWSEASKELYDVLLNPFRAHKLTIGEVTDLSEAALEKSFSGNTAAPATGHFGAAALQIIQDRAKFTPLKRIGRWVFLVWKS